MLLALVTAVPAADVQTVVVHASFVSVLPNEVQATIQQDGASRVVRLVDDGSDVHDARGDRVWSGSVEGEPAQYLPITLAATVDGQTRDVWNGVVRVGLERSVELAFEVTSGPDGKLIGARRASASPGRVSHATEVVPLMAASFWATFLLVYGAVALKMRGEVRGPPVASGASRARAGGRE
jgi:hypothetical protein